MAIATINPATGETVRTFEPLTGAELEAKLSLPAAAFQHQRRSSFGERAEKMTAAAKCATACRYYATHAERMLADEPIPGAHPPGRPPLEGALSREELFGPVAMLFRACDLDEAIRIANATPFGLGASLWTQDETEQHRGVHELQAGQVFVNGIVASQPALPFGGIKDSGYGRELGLFGIREFVNAKSVRIG
jgi:acyl-CoA reductase-like NAD-dependent aldehyde dehydrogenase